MGALLFKLVALVGVGWAVVTNAFGVQDAVLALFVWGTQALGAFFAEVVLGPNLERLADQSASPA